MFMHFHNLILILLTHWTHRLLGISPEVGRQIEQTQLYFAGGWPATVGAIVLVAGAVWFGWLYWKDGTHPSWGIKALLLALRMMALTALVLMLLQPMLRLIHSEQQRANVLLMVDNSLSMARRDSRLPPDRIARIARVIGGNPTAMTRAEIVERIANRSQEKLIAELARRFHVRLYTFGSEARSVALPKTSDQLTRYALRVQPDPRLGNSTQIGTALKRALDDLAGLPVAGALIISDGANNLGDDPLALAERAREQQVPLSTLGIGDPTPTKDLAITDVLADQVVRKDSVAQASVGLLHRGYEGQTVTLTLRRGNTLVGTKTLLLGAASRKHTVTFTYTPKQPGDFRHTVSVTSLPEEITTDNNRRSFLQRVITKRLRILYVEGEPRWEYRYLKNAILRDKQIAFSCFLTASGAQYGGEGNVPIYRFPPDEKSLFDFDILILGDVPRRFFTDTQIRNIRRFVEDKGGSLIVIAGEKHMPQEYRDTPLAGVFPVILPVSPEQVVTREPFQWELTPEGRQDPLLRMADDPAQSERIWRKLPGMFWNAGVERAKPGATVLAVNAVRSNAYGKRIVLAVQRFGAGRCLMSLVDSTWRWRYRVGDRYFYRYWGQAIRAMTPQETPGGNRFAQISADRVEYRLGERVSLHARLLDPFYRPVKAREVTAYLRGETGAPTPFTLNAIPGSPGLYTADFVPERVGKFEVSIAPPPNPTAKATTSFLVQNVALEDQQPELNEALLKRVAHAAGGNYYLPDELSRWLQSLPDRPLTVRSETDIELWDVPLLLLLFIVPLSTEWLIRKRSGML